MNYKVTIEADAFRVCMHVVNTTDADFLDEVVAMIKRRASEPAVPVTPKPETRGEP